jgi:hypothetical protein
MHLIFALEIEYSKAKERCRGGRESRLDDLNERFKARGTPLALNSIRSKLDGQPLSILPEPN